MKVHLISLAVAGLIGLFGCSSKMKKTKSTTKEIADQASVSLLADPGFTKGLSLSGAVSGVAPAGQSIYPFGAAGEHPDWALAEWASRYLLDQKDLAITKDTISFENKGKLIRFKKMPHTTYVRMDVKASKEYEHLRKPNEPWPHLLIEQSFADKPFLKDVRDLRLNLQARLVHCIPGVPADRLDPALHTAQFQIFIVVQNGNSESEKYGDYLWFGVPFYDYRYRQQAVYAAQDIGKGDATGKFIYSIATADVTAGSFHDGDWIPVAVDLKPFMVKAILLAKERGYLAGSQVDEFRVVGMNLGWEVPGIFDAGFEFKGFDLRYTPNKK